MAVGEGGHELRDAVPQRFDPVEVDLPFPIGKDTSKRPIFFGRLRAVDALFLQSLDARAKPFAQQGKSRKIAFGEMTHGASPSVARERLLALAEKLRSRTEEANNTPDS